MITLHASGTQNSTVGTTEYSLASSTLEGGYVFEIDMNDMANGDVAELKVNKIILTAGTKRVLYNTIFYGAQPAWEIIKTTPMIWNDLSTDNALEFTLTQSLGSTNAFPWKVMRDRAISGSVEGQTITVSTGGAINVSSSAGIPTGAHAAGELNSIADGVLDRSMSVGTDSGTDSTGTRTVRQALRMLRNRRDAASTGAVYREDDTTIDWTFNITRSTSNPISVINPT